RPSEIPMPKSQTVIEDSRAATNAHSSTLESQNSETATSNPQTDLSDTTHPGSPAESPVPGDAKSRPSEHVTSDSFGFSSLESELPQFTETYLDDWVFS